jgi:Uma2 family endonuclease
MVEAAIRQHPFSRDEYEHAVAAGVFHPEARLELLEGEILEMPPQSSLHSTALQLCADALRTAFGPGYVIRVQMPLALTQDSEPEPDITVVVGHARDYRDAHPSSALLVVEVAENSLLHDRGRKQAAYARAGIPEYWIVNLKKRCVETYRDPRAGSYRVRTVALPSDMLRPPALSAAQIAVCDLLP